MLLEHLTGVKGALVVFWQILMTTDDSRLAICGLYSKKDELEVSLSKIKQQKWGQ